MFNDDKFEIVAKFKEDLKEDQKVYAALVLLLKQLFKIKVTYDLFGKDYNKSLTKEEI